MQTFETLSPGINGFAWNLPFLPRLVQRGIQLCAEQFELGLKALPDHVDLGIICDLLKFYVWCAVIDEALANVAVGRSFRWWFACNLAFLATALWRIGEIVIGKLRAHYARAGKRQCYARSIDSNPSSSTLLGNKRCSP